MLSGEGEYWKMFRGEKRHGVGGSTFQRIWQKVRLGVRSQEIIENQGVGITETGWPGPLWRQI